MSTTLDVVGIGHAIVDNNAMSSDDFLKTHEMTKGSMMLIDEERAERIYAAMGPGSITSGGSASNTISGIAKLGGSAGYIGKVRDDQLGQAFRHDITAAGAIFRTPPAASGPATARCFILVTPDSQRTMNTFLGACVNLTIDDIDAELYTIRTGNAPRRVLLYDEPAAKASVSQSSCHRGTRPAAKSASLYIGWPSASTGTTKTSRNW